MGLYDHYLPEPPLVCRRCGGTLDSFIPQGKDGPCKFLLWRQGKAEPADQLMDTELKAPLEELRALRLPPSFEIVAGCSGCGDWVDVTGFCDDGVWTRCVLGRHVNAVPIPARAVHARWRQCSGCTEAWEEDDSVELSGCPACGALTRLDDAST